MSTIITKNELQAEIDLFLAAMTSDPEMGYVAPLMAEPEMNWEVNAKDAPESADVVDAEMEVMADDAFLEPDIDWLEWHSNHLWVTF